VVGYHADASSLAPTGWIAGSEWSWADLYEDIVQTALDGDFTDSKYNANFRSGLKDGLNPFVQSKFGASVSQETKDLVEAAAKDIAGSGSPFKGPILSQDGKELVAAGVVPDYATIEETMVVFVKGVVGQMPQS
jgi:basic membrane protein A